MKIIDLLTDSTKWTKGAYARDSKGNTLGTGRDKLAKCFCLTGALEHCYPGSTIVHGSPFAIAFRKLGDTIHKHTHSINIITFNDNDLTTFERVREIIKLADV